MTYKKIGLNALGLTFGLLGLATTSFAGPIPASLALAPGGSVAGESDLNANSGSTSVNVDWIVSLNGAGTIYTYEYQIENTSNTVVSNFSLSLGADQLANVVTVGFDGTDLDSTHSVGTFGNLVGEEEPAGGIGGTISPGSTGIVAGSGIKWTFTVADPLQATEQSGRLFFTSTQGPAYGFGTIQDSQFIWASTNSGSDKIPVPAPEPTTFLGGVLGLAAVALYARKRKKGLNA